MYNIIHIVNTAVCGIYKIVNPKSSLEGNFFLFFNFMSIWMIGVH